MWVKARKAYNRCVGNVVSPSPPIGFEYYRGELRLIQARSVSPRTEDHNRLYNETANQVAADAIEQHRVSDEELQLAVNTMIAGMNAQYGINLDITDIHVRWIIKRIISLRGLSDDTVILIQRCRPLLHAISGGISGGISDVIRPAIGIIAQGVSRRRARSRSADRPVSVEPNRDEQQRALGFANSALTGLYAVYKRIYGFLGTCAGAACDLVARRRAAVEQAVPAEAQNLECSICMADAITIVGQVPGQEAMLTPCNHRFHGSCINAWIAECVTAGRDATCPYCRGVPTPLSLIAAAPGGGGGGLKKKYRGARSKSKSKRYRRNPRKTRKV